jgi:hypothetical protein
MFYSYPETRKAPSHERAFLVTYTDERLNHLFTISGFKRHQYFFILFNQQKIPYLPASGAAASVLASVFLATFFFVAFFFLAFALGAGASAFASVVTAGFVSAALSAAKETPPKIPVIASETIMLAIKFFFIFL